MINHKPHASQNFPKSSGLWLLQTLALRHPVVLSIEDAAERRHLATAVRYSLVRVCHSPDAGRPKNRIRSHLKVAGWLASAFCKPFSTSLKPKNGLNTFGKTLGKRIGKPWFTSGNTRKCSGTHSHPTKKWFAGPLCKPYLR